MLTTDLKTRLRALARRRHRPMAKPDRLATMAMTTLQTLYDATGGRLEWRDIDQVVLQPEHFEALEYAVGQQWVEVSRPHSMTPGAR